MPTGDMGGQRLEISRRRESLPFAFHMAGTQLDPVPQDLLLAAQMREGRTQKQLPERTAPIVRSARLNTMARGAWTGSGLLSSGGDGGIGTLCDRFSGPYPRRSRRSLNRGGPHEGRESA
jgi:hypothetical protein